MNNIDPSTIFDDVIDPDDPSLDIYKDIKEKVNFEKTPTNLRRHFIYKAAPLIDNYINVALGKEVPISTNAKVQHEVWSVLKEIILTAKNPAPLMDIKGHTIEDQVSKILTMVSTGKCTLEEGKDYLALVQQGFELTELPKLMSQMESLEELGVIK